MDIQNEKIEEQEMNYLSREEISNFTKRLSGKNELGESKVIITYQLYDFDEPETSIDKERIYSVKNASIELSLDNKYPQFYVCDIIFKNFNDPELRMLWGRLQKFKRNLALEGNKNWIFYLNILEKDSISVRTENKDILFLAHVFNPTLFNLTREIPEYLALDTIDNENQLSGGNIIRMLIPIEFISFDIRDDIDTSIIKGEVERELEEERFINNIEDYKENSNWY